MFRALASILLVAACENGGDGGSPDDTSTTCNEENEDCAVGTCGGEGAEMLPGSDCLLCHTGEGGEDRATAAREEEAGPRYTVAGTVFADLDGSAPLAGATVRLLDDQGTSVLELQTNAAGNFYSSQALTFPLQTEIDVGGEAVAMSTLATTGACSSCHLCAGSAGGKLTGP